MRLKSVCVIEKILMRDSAFIQSDSDVTAFAKKAAESL